MNKVLVTGSAGFIGWHTVKALLSKMVAGYTVWGVDNNSHVADGQIRADITDFPKMDMIFKNCKPDAVIHLAAQPSLQESWHNAHLDATVNILGTIILLGLCQSHKVKRFVFASTSAVYAPKESGVYLESDRLQPQNPYGASKMAAEAYVRISGINYAILRLGNVYGPRQRPLGENQLIPRALAHIYQGEPFVINGDGVQTRDFVYVKDVAEAFVKAAESDAQGIFNIGRGSSVSANKVLRHVYYNTHLPGIMEGPREADTYWKHGPPNPDELRHVNLPSHKAYRRLGWKAIYTPRFGIPKVVKEWPK